MSIEPMDVVHVVIFGAHADATNRSAQSFIVIMQTLTSTMALTANRSTELVSCRPAPSNTHRCEQMDVNAHCDKSVENIIFISLIGHTIDDFPHHFSASQKAPSPSECVICQNDDDERKFRGRRARRSVVYIRLNGTR